MLSCLAQKSREAFEAREEREIRKLAKPATLCESQKECLIGILLCFCSVRWIIDSSPCTPKISSVKYTFLSSALWS